MCDEKGKISHFVRASLANCLNGFIMSSGAHYDKAIVEFTILKHEQAYCLWAARKCKSYEVHNTQFINATSALSIIYVLCTCLCKLNGILSLPSRRTVTTSYKQAPQIAILCVFQKSRAFESNLASRTLLKVFRRFQPARNKWPMLCSPAPLRCYTQPNWLEMK